MSPRFSNKLHHLDELTLAGVLAPSRIAQALRMKRFVSDGTFDRFMGDECRPVSAEYWTPLAAARRTAEWLDQLQIHTVLDIGSGAGKFCVVAALACRARFTGIEQRTRLVAAARDLAQLFEVHDRVTFVRGTFGDSAPMVADAYYLFNPFEENLFEPDDRLDGDVELGKARFARDIAATEQLLSDARVGTYLITYNGFGGRVPTCYRELRVDRNLPNVLRLWRKMWPKSADNRLSA